MTTFDGSIEPGRVFDVTTGLDGVPDGYRAMDDHDALNVLIRGAARPTVRPRTVRACGARRMFATAHGAHLGRLVPLPDPTETQEEHDMATVTIIGAGPGLGAATARRFGTEGYDVALIARTQRNLDALAEELQQAAITARGYAADVCDPDALTDALDRAETELGAIEGVQYSLVPQRDYLKPVLDTTSDDLAAAFEVLRAGSGHGGRAGAAGHA